MHLGHVLITLILSLQNSAAQRQFIEITLLGPDAARLLAPCFVEVALDFSLISWAVSIHVTSNRFDVFTADMN